MLQGGWSHPGVRARSSDSGATKTGDGNIIQLTRLYRAISPGRWPGVFISPLEVSWQDGLPSTNGASSMVENLKAHLLDLAIGNGWTRSYIQKEGGKRGDP